MSQFELEEYGDESQTSQNYIPKTQIKDVLRSLNVSNSPMILVKFSYGKVFSRSRI